MNKWLLEHQCVVNWTGIVAILVAIGRTVGLSWTEPLPWMSEAGDLAYDAALAWATAWAFQLLVIAWPERREREKFELLIRRRVDRLIQVGMDFQRTMSMKVGAGTVPEKFEVDHAVLAKLCETTELRDRDVPGWTRASWADYLEQLAHACEIERAMLRPLYGRLTPDLLVALDEEENHMGRIERSLLIYVTLDSKGMERLEGSLFGWLSAIHMLVVQRETTLSPDVELPCNSEELKDVVRVPKKVFLEDYKSAKAFPGSPK